MRDRGQLKSISSDELEKKPDIGFSNFTARVGVRFYRRQPCIELVLSNFSDSYMQLRAAVVREGSYYSNRWHAHVNNYVSADLFGITTSRAGTCDITNSGLSLLRVVIDRKGRQCIMVSVDYAYLVEGFIKYVKFLSAFDGIITECAAKPKKRVAAKKGGVA